MTKIDPNDPMFRALCESDGDHRAYVEAHRDALNRRFDAPPRVSASVLGVIAGAISGFIMGFAACAAFFLTRV